MGKLNQPCKILLVDDEISILKAMKAGLENRGYEVETASDAESALGMLQSDAFDVMVTDYKMPGISGVELIERAWEYREELGCILVSGHLYVDNLIKSRRDRLLFIEKPFGVHEIIERIKTLCSCC